MKKLIRAFLVFISILGSTIISNSQVIKEKASDNDKGQIQNLIKQMLNWSQSKKSIDLLPTLTDVKDNSCVGFNFDKHKLNLKKLKATNLFAEEFIKNYDQIIITLDKKIKNKEFEKWNINELPTFAFANDVNPWCLCQDVPYDKPNPWDFIEIDVINLAKDKGELDWRWGKLEVNSDSGWQKFTYKFRVVKENDKWKIAYLEGFDFKNSIRKNEPRR